MTLRATRTHHYNVNGKWYEVTCSAEHIVVHGATVYHNGTPYTTDMKVSPEVHAALMSASALDRSALAFKDSLSDEDLRIEAEMHGTTVDVMRRVKAEYARELATIREGHCMCSPKRARPVRTCGWLVCDRPECSRRIG